MRLAGWGVTILILVVVVILATGISAIVTPSPIYTDRGMVAIMQTAGTTEVVILKTEGANPTIFQVTIKGKEAVAICRDDSNKVTCRIYAPWDPSAQ